MTRRLVALVVIITWVLAMPAFGQEEIIDTVGTHRVKSGETLSSITATYLGDPLFWRENWKLNPQVDDPNRLKPGQHLSIILERRVIARGARVKAVSNKVDKNLQRTSWQPASSGDELAQRDGIRTLRSSSAELQFNNNALLRLSEYSQIFLETKETTKRGVDRGRIEVREGSADLLFEPLSPKRTEIQLVTGNSVAIAEANADGRGQLRTAASANGEAQVMVFEGRSKVSADGAQVDVPKGFGTAVPKTGPPAPPEKLLPAPVNLRAAPTANWRVANETIRWQPVTGAVSYIVEICRDRDCGDLARRQQVTQAQWQPELSEQGDFFVRVMGVAGSKLQGYASEPLVFSLTTDRLDRHGPVVALVPIGFHQARGDGWLVGPATKFRLVGHDDGVGVKRIEYRWQTDGDDWQQWQGQDLSLPAGATSLSIRASDHLAQTQTQTIQIVDDL